MKGAEIWVNEFIRYSLDIGLYDNKFRVEHWNKMGFYISAFMSYTYIYDNNWSSDDPHYWEKRNNWVDRFFSDG